VRPAPTSEEVRAASEEVVSHTPVEEMKERARAFYEQHRERIEAPLS
jgi:hypothetical protein